MMHNSTKNKFHILNRYIRRHYRSLLNKYPDIVGVHIGQKIKAGKNTRKYSLIFHVIKKKKSKPGNTEIPKFFKVKFGESYKKIPTDVIESGKGSLSDINPGDKVFHRKFPSSFGSTSIFLTNDSDIFLLTNMHVIGKSQLRSSFEVSDVPHDFSNAEIICTEENIDNIDLGCFKSGVVNDFIDAAIAIINPVFHDIVENTIDNSMITEPEDLDFSVATENKKVFIKGTTSGMIENVFINSNTAVRTFKYPLGGMTLFDLLQISPCKTRGGDSGSPIIDSNSRKLLGIVVGKDNKNTFTYGIPINTILDFFELKILKTTL